MKERYSKIISERLERDAARLREEFLRARPGVPTRFVALDDVLPETDAREIYRAFPPSREMRHLRSFRERKYSFKQLDKVPAILEDITFAMQGQPMIAAVEKITGIRGQRPDPSLYAGGLSMMIRGDFLNPHIDNSHDGERKLYRTLNLLYYVSPGWKPEYGGSLELWDDRVQNAVTIPSLFNRLVIMETNRHSWHSVSPIRHDGQRCCVSNYYFSARPPEGPDYFHVTSFSARPEQPIRRLVAAADNLARMGIRRIFSKGIGKRDLYRSDPPN